MSSSTSSLLSSGSSLPSSTVPDASLTTSPALPTASDVVGTSTTSSSFPPPFPSRSSRPERPQSNNGIAGNSQLYLFTFLATLVLLLGISSAIILRSFILRRRHRRMIDAAIANGTYIPPDGRKHPKVDLSKKPKVWNVHIPPDTHHHPEKKSIPGTWDLQPFSLQNLIPNTDHTENPSQRTPTRQQRQPRIIGIRTIRNLFTPTSLHPVDPSPPPSPAQCVSDVDTIQLGVMVLMPSADPPRIRAHGDEEDDDDEELPWVEMGVLAANVTKNGGEAELDDPKEPMKDG